MVDQYTLRVCDMQGTWRTVLCSTDKEQIQKNCDRLFAQKVDGKIRDFTIFAERIPDTQADLTLEAHRPESEE